MPINISNDICVAKSKIDQAALDLVFMIENPKFADAIKWDRSTFGIPRFLKLYDDRQPDYYSFPRGELARIIPIIKGGPDEFIDETVSNPVPWPTCKIEPRSYQQGAIDALTSKNQGLLCAACGSGKTAIATKVLSHLQQKSIILVHTQALLEQWREVISEQCGFMPAIIQGGSVAGVIESPCTVAMVQTLNKRDYWRSLNLTDLFGAVVLDECHHVAAQFFGDVLGRFKARYRFGLTATPERADGLTFLLNAHFGNTLYSITHEDLAQAGFGMPASVQVVPTRSAMTSFTTDYHEVIDHLVNDAERDQLIIDTIAGQAEKPCLALSERVAHLEQLNQLAEHAGIESAVLCGKVKKADRKQILEDFKAGKIKVLFSSKVADEGLDLPMLQRLFLCLPIKSKARLTQQTGRLLRVCEGKKDAVIFDFVDQFITMPKQQFFSRMREVYKPMNFQIDGLGALR